MAYTLTIRPEAELDIEEHYTAYEGKRAGLGHDFLLCVEEALDKLPRNPLIYRKFHEELRRVPVRRFPYRVMYFVNGQKIIVAAVFHVRKEPTSWGGRA
ncbi:MAG: type II toxin-antitoxin system RelE/ParE family toxin [Alcanivoracaceae bacterium]